MTTSTVADAKLSSRQLPHSCMRAALEPACSGSSQLPPTHDALIDARRSQYCSPELQHADIAEVLNSPVRLRIYHSLPCQMPRRRGTPEFLVHADNGGSEVTVAFSPDQGTIVEFVHMWVAPPAERK